MTKDVKIGLAIGLLLLVVLFVWLAAKSPGPSPDAKNRTDAGKSDESGKTADKGKKGPAVTSSDATGYFGDDTTGRTAKSGTQTPAVDTGIAKRDEESVAEISVGDQPEKGLEWGLTSRDAVAGTDRMGDGTGRTGVGTDTNEKTGESTMRKTDEAAVKTDAQKFLEEYLAQYGKETGEKTTGTGTRVERTSHGLRTVGATSHVVKPGETLSRISAKYYGTTAGWRDIGKANRIADPARIHPGMVLTIPERAAKATGTPLTGVTASDGLQRHVVAPGETPGQISTKYYGTSRYWKNILEANGIDDPTRVGAGTTLIIPDLKEATTPGPGPAEDTLTTRTPGPDEHVVKPGETLTEISHKYYGTGRYVKDIMKANGIEDATRLQAGQVIKIPAKPERRRHPLDRLPGTTEPTLRPGERRYTVKSNETLAAIAARELGSWRLHKDIQKRNGIADPTRIQPGQVIILPAASSTHFLSTTDLD